MSSDARPSDAPIEPVGRTWADILFAGRRMLLLILGVVVLLALVAIYRPDLSDISEWYRDNKPAIRAFVLAFILMFVIGRFITLRLISVQTVDYLVLDFVNLRGAVYRIPVPLLSLFRISGGNNLQLSWRDGHVFKLARSVSIEDGIIETAWPHQVPIEQARRTIRMRRSRTFCSAAVPSSSQRISPENRTTISLPSSPISLSSEIWTWNPISTDWIP